MNEATVNDALSELLSALGFDAMARDVRTEESPARLRKYAAVILKQTPDRNRKRELYSRFAMLRLL